MNRSGLVAAGLVLCSAMIASSQTNLSWHTMDGGGGTSTGGVFTLDGTVGQPDGHDAMQGGVFEVQGGFWALVELVQTPGAPLLRIAAISTSSVTLAWPMAGAEGFQLQHASSLVEPDWTPVPGTPSGAGTEYQLTTGPLVVKHYYRLRKQ